MITILTTVPCHLRQLIMNLREADRKEVESFGITAQKGLWVSYRNSVRTKTAFVDNKIGAIWGCGGNLLGDTGRPWLLTSPESEKVPLSFVKIYRAEVSKMLERYPKLSNYVAAEYTKAVKLLELSGFTLGDPEPYGKNKAMFRKFSIEA